MQKAGYFTGIRHKVGALDALLAVSGWDLDPRHAPDGRPARSEGRPSPTATSTEQGIHAARAGGQAVLPGDQRRRSAQAVLRRGEAGPDVPTRTCRRECSRPRKCRFPASCSTTRSSARNWPTTTRRCGGPTTASARCSTRSTASGERDRHVIMFLSDHGMPLPFAKTQLYHHSTQHAADRPLARRDEGRRGRQPAHGLGRRFAADAARR